MRQFPLIPFLLFLIASAIASNTLFGDRSLASLREADQKVKTQQRKNQKIQNELDNIRETVHGLRNDDRAIEKEIRNKMKVRREDETVFLFNN